MNIKANAVSKIAKHTFGKENIRSIAFSTLTNFVVGKKRQ